MNNNNNLLLKLGLLTLLISAYVLPTAHAEQIISFSKAKKHLVKLYKANPAAQTFYCGCDIKWKGKKGIPDAESCGYVPRNEFTKKGNVNQRAKRIEWEHVMPAYWFGRQLQCWQDGGRKACKKVKAFKQVEGDLHNLRPAIGELNADRSNYRFSMLEGEKRRYGQCDFEVEFKANKAEPPENVQRDIARTYFYMADRYKLKLSTSQKQLLVVWNNSDAVDAWERMRNQKIKSIQGNANPFIQ
jgi:deoxyribonuclease-1